MINYRKNNYDKIYPYYPKIYNKIQKILVLDNMRIIFQKTKKEFIEKKIHARTTINWKNLGTSFPSWYISLPTNLYKLINDN